jgi:hypothetical protein
MTLGELNRHTMPSFAEYGDSLARTFPTNWVFNGWQIGLNANAGKLIAHHYSTFLKKCWLKQDLPDITVSPGTSQTASFVLGKTSGYK